MSDQKQMGNMLETKHTILDQNPYDSSTYVENIFRLQRAFAGRFIPFDQCRKDIKEQQKWNMELAACVMDELSEVLNWLNWKHWKKTDYFTTHKALSYVAGLLLGDAGINKDCICFGTTSNNSQWFSLVKLALSEAGLKVYDNKPFDNHKEINGYTYDITELRCQAKCPESLLHVREQFDLDYLSENFDFVEVVRAWFDSDGTIIKRLRKNKHNEELKSRLEEGEQIPDSSFEYYYQIQLYNQVEKNLVNLSLKLKILFNIDSTVTQNSRGSVYTLYIAQGSVSTFLEKIGFRHPDKTRENPAYQSGLINLPELKFELIDILHFLVNISLVNNFGPDKGLLKPTEYAKPIKDPFELQKRFKPLLIAMNSNLSDLVITSESDSQRLIIRRCFRVLDKMFGLFAMTEQEIYIYYTSKNQENYERQERGY